MNTFKDHKNYTIESINIGILTSFLVLFRARSLKDIYDQNFRHGTEIMKLCQEIVCPVYSFNYQEKCIEQSRHCEHLQYWILFIFTIRWTHIRRFSFVCVQTA